MRLELPRNLRKKGGKTGKDKKGQDWKGGCPQLERGVFGYSGVLNRTCKQRLRVTPLHGQRVDNNLNNNKDNY
jgi:hypothetical protein